MTWAAAQSPTVPVAHENVDFTPPQDKKYLRFFLLPAPTDSLFLEGTDREYLGIMQITVVMPQGNGPKAAEDMITSLSGLFPNNLRLTSGSVTVQLITPVGNGPFIMEEDAFTVPLSSTYRAFVT